MQLHNIQRIHKNKDRKRVGRGGSRGKTSGRGHKGQRAHGAKAPRPEMRDIIKKLPKRRGYGKNRARTVNPNAERPAAVNVAVLGRFFTEGEKVTPESLVAKGVIAKSKGRIPKVKILGQGTLSKKLVFSHLLVSSSARHEIEKAGGVIE